MKMKIAIGVVILIVGLVVGIKLLGLAWWLVWTLVAGLIIGAIARQVLGGKKMSLMSTALYGITGSFVGKLAAGILGFGTLIGLVLSVVGAVVLIGATHTSK